MDTILVVRNIRKESGLRGMADHRGTRSGCLKQPMAKAVSGSPRLQSWEVHEFRQERRAESDYTEEEIAILDSVRSAVPREEYWKRDMPEGTVATAPYYTDLNVMVALK